jgi:hypothetical protein
VINTETTPCEPGSFVHSDGTYISMPTDTQGIPDLEHARKAVEVFDQFHQKIVKYQKDKTDRL